MTSWRERGSQAMRVEKRRKTRQQNSVKRRRIRARVYERDGYQCVYCGSASCLTLDHVLPMVRGGGFTFDNLVTACQQCNKARGGELWSGPVQLDPRSDKRQLTARKTAADQRWYQGTGKPVQTPTEH